MKRVNFGDIVREVKVQVDRNNNPYIHYVAGDHMDSMDLTIRRKGSFATDDVGPAFIRIFKPGQVLYGSRRTYLKKIAVADFEGICSNTTFVLETKDSNVFLQELLPFVMLSESFTKWSISHSKGSTNPYVLFSDLANYEFTLPSLSEQKVLADKLWAAYRVKESYKKLLAATDDMLKAKFQEMFGRLDKNRIVKDVANVVSGKSIPTKYEDIIGNIAYVKVADFNIPGNERYIKTSSRFVTLESASLSKYVSSGSVLFAKNGAAALSNKKRLTVIDCCIDMNTIAIVPSKDKIYPEYLLSVFENTNIEDFVRQGAIPSISPKDIENMAIPLPPLPLQQQFVEIATQAEATKESLRKSIKSIDQVIKSLINQ